MMEYGLALQEPGVAGLLLAFGGGVLTSFTPCVYPLIPITVALFGASRDTPPLRSFLLSCSYVLGIAVTFTALGLFAAATGAVFGSVLGNPWVVGVVVVLLSLLALFTLDLVRIPGLHQLQNKASKIGSRGHLGAFVMGTLSGPVAAPCVGPALVAILSVAATTGDTVWGGALLAAYSLGLGTLFLLVGTFSGFLARLPRSGNWMHGVKFLLAAALFTVAFFFLQPFWELPGAPRWLLGFLAGVAVLLAVVAYRKEMAVLKPLAALLFAFAAFEAVLPGTESISAGTQPSANSSNLVWHSDLETALTAAREAGNPLMIDFAADWCAACKELEAITFPNPLVRDTLSGFVLAKIDFTIPDDSIAQRYGIVGLPLVLFLDSDGNEIPGTRIQQFLPPAEFNQRAQAALEAAS